MNNLEEFGTSKSASPVVVRSDQQAVPSYFGDDDDEKKESIQWEVVNNKTFKAQGRTVPRLAPAFYAISYDHNHGGYIYEKIDVKVDSLIAIPNGIAETVLQDINDFWKKEKTFKELGFLHYRGYLLYGPHGSGKTCLIHMIAKNIIDNGGLIFVCKNPNDLIEGIKDFREIEPNRQIICLFEDIEAMIKSFGEEKILAFLDGEYKIDKVLNLATTNYPELLDKRLVGRPRRFDRIIKIEYPDAAARKTYFKVKLPAKDVDKWVKATEGLSFAALAELVISVKCLGKKFEEALEIMKNIQNKDVSSTEDKPKVGFTQDE